MSNEMRTDAAERMQRLVKTIDTARLLTEPLTNSIESLLQTSAAELNSDEASVLIREGDDGSLKFLSVIGAVADQLVNMRIPPGKGIAGFVMSSGQPMVVSDVAEEESFYSEVDKKTGYSTQMILATPLRHNGEIIGVLEYVNRRGEPPFEPFTPDEMDRAAIYAEPIATIVSAYESSRLLHQLGDTIIGGEPEADIAELRSWLTEMRATQEHREMIELAVLVRELSGRGEAERKLCVQILESLIAFTDSRPDTSYLKF